MKHLIPLILALSATSALAADPVGDAAKGRDLFLANCSTCHGADAIGDGPMAPALARPPANLTALAAGMDFPVADVVRWIDGRDIIAHGGPMPLFGEILTDRSAVVDDAAANPVFTTQAVLDIVAWLQTVQE